MKCVPTPAVGHVPASFSHLLVLKAVLKDASVMLALFLMVSSVFPWTAVGVCTTADM